MEKESDFLSIKEFASKVGLHHNTVRRLIKSCKISAVNIGSGKYSYFRIPKSEIGRLAIDNHMRWEEINKICE
jgi:excisionase family DNA binding protein